jgi:hypothetical protein
MPMDKVPPIRPGKMFKGGWNPDGPRPDPNFRPAPFGIPFAPQQPASPSPTRTRQVSAAVPPIRPDKRFKGGWNPACDH